MHDTKMKRKVKMVVKGISRKIFRRIALESSPTVHLGGGPIIVRKNDLAIRLGGKSNIFTETCVFSRTKRFCFENDVFLAFGLGMCEGVSEDSRHGIGHVDIQVGSCICLSVIGCHDM